MYPMNQRYKRDTGYDYEHRRRHSRSRSRSRHRRYRRDDSRSRSRSRSRSISYRRRYGGIRSHSRSRSRSRGYGRRDARYNASRRYRDSRSRSRSYSRSPPSRSQHRNINRDSRSRSTEKHLRHERRRDDDDNGQNANEVKRSPVKSDANKQQNQIKQDAIDSQDEANEETKEDTDLQNLPLPKREPIGAYYNLDTDEPFDKERIHREMEEKLRQALAREGKVYPPKKPEASHPVFANDGSFLELFKKMQEQQQQQHTSMATATVTATNAALPAVTAPMLASTSSNTASAYIAATSSGKLAPPPPIVARRRGGKILKTGVVAKPKAQSEQSEDPKDFWSLYLAEVNKYKSHACETDTEQKMSKKDQKNPPKPEYKLETVPMDPRFPNANVTKHCWFSYVEFHRCQKSRGEGHETCAYFQKVFKTMCPNEWVEKWDEQREAGVFPGRI